MTREWHTIPELARAIGVQESLLHDFADEGLLVTVQTPKSYGKKRRLVVPDHLPEFLIGHLLLKKDRVTELMETLGYSFFKTAAA